MAVTLQSQRLHHSLQLINPMRIHFILSIGLYLLFWPLPKTNAIEQDRHPNIIFVMADDQGWGQTGYYNHPVLQTPNLDAMAESGLRMDRFYAGAPVCSPTRASVLTGRANDRTGVPSHGHALRRQEISLARILGDAGYVTGHFGKWHLNGLRGPGVPILHSDTHHPGRFGFQTWVSVTNFFDRDPLMSRRGKFVQLEGDSSDVAMEEALKFIRRQAKAKQRFFSVIWYGTPHSPFLAGNDDRQPFESLDKDSMHQHGELVAMDRSLGSLRRELRNLAIADNTILWYCSDNGGLKKIKPDTVGGLRGNKGTIFEGGLRVPGIIEWPSVIKPRVTNYPAGVIDMFPTIIDILELEPDLSSRPIDGISLLPLMKEQLKRRQKPIPFRYQNAAALVDNNFKLLTNNLDKGKFELYNLEEDRTESTNLAKQLPHVTQQMTAELLKWNRSVEASVAGLDYPEKKVHPDEPSPRFWTEVEAYQPYLKEWESHWEYKPYIERTKKDNQ